MKGSEIKAAYDRMNPTQRAKDRMFEKICSEQPKRMKQERIYTATAQESQGWKLIPTLLAFAALLAVCLLLFRGRQDPSPVLIDPTETSHDTAPTENIPTETTEPEVPSTVEAFLETPFYQACTEWYDYLQENGDQEAEYVDYKYRGYQAVNRNMVERLQELLKTYDLGLYDEEDIGSDSYDYFLKNCGIGSIYKENTDHACHEGNDCHEVDTCHEVGNCWWCDEIWFYVSGTVTLSGENTPWIYPVNYVYYRTSTKYLCSFFLDIGHLEDYDVWEYITEAGDSLILALNDDLAAIIRYDGEYVTFVKVENPRAGDILYGEQKMTREALESVAETFDFSPALDGQ